MGIHSNVIMKLGLVASSVLALGAYADVPTNCFVDDLWGDWTFTVGLQGDAETVTTGADYHNLGDATATYHFSFSEYNMVVNSDTGATGEVTTIYNQGFEFRINSQIWFMNWYFDGPVNSYDCSKTCVGFVSDTQGKNWGRVEGSNNNAKSLLRTMSVNPETDPAFEGKYQADFRQIQEIKRAAEGVWYPTFYPEHEKYTNREMIRRAGAQRVPVSYSERYQTRDISGVVEKAIENNKKVMAENKHLPTQMDWRNVDGVNFVGTVDDQGGCGSCYSFASMGLLESRVRIETNNQQQPKFSEQEMITCGKDKTYNQGCVGGFAFQNAGRYASTFGVVEESCAPYNPSDRSCPDTTGCKRWYTSSDYEYLGGYYGATTTDGGAAMMTELATNGPIAVGFMVLDDFSSYSGGVYVNTASVSAWNPFVPVNHAVLMVGYGTCDGDNTPDCGTAPDGTPFWIVKNSWGTGWGLSGYFLILRGVDEVGIESVPFVAHPAPQL